MIAVIVLSMSSCVVSNGMPHRAPAQLRNFA
jgi:hypothetical protein